MSGPPRRCVTNWIGLYAANIWSCVNNLISPFPLNNSIISSHVKSWSTSKDSPYFLQKWEDLFKTTAANNLPSSSTNSTPVKLRTQHPQILSIEAEKTALNNNLHLLRDIINYRESIFKIPATLRTKAEDYLSLIESQFNYILSFTHDQQPLNTSNRDATTQSSPPDSIHDVGTQISQEQGLRNNSIDDNSLQSSPSSLLLLPTTQALETKVNLSVLLSTFLPAPEVQIQNIKQVRSNVLAVSMATSNDSEKLIAEITSNEILNSSMTIKIPKKRHPSVIVYNVQNDVEESEIQQAFRKCTFNETDLKFRFKFKGSSPNHQNWVFEVPVKDFSILTKLDKIPLRWLMHKMGEFHHYKMCNYCQSFGHTTKDCQYSTPSCGHCAGYHMTRDCTHEHLSCVNCYNNNLKFGTVYPIGHHTKSRSCPCLQNVIKNFINTRDYI
ncbi:hypothetical protein AVEN_43560-1 [Araneus ventricosus]|uniref:CCHC-type domain-containing protein n=1 Tax=Araneus ventricosus TaxID=182803 RepID=A0A4Y2ELE7_ARAVE|nr:hypothetical protein AVEN_43560-1 [Araneus ventricosus]